TKRHLIIDGRSVNYTSAKDVGEVLDLIYNRKYVSKDASEVILGHMLDQVHTNKIPSGLPEGVKVANKTGELGTNEHDSAIVWADNCTYEIVIMSEGVNIRSIGYKEVAQISNVVYKYMTETED
ncbi:MAG: serine hydrolase, partial [Firmicutes bacterium]|nr:serine hydrolase [Bacillota bacterium]